MICLKSLQEILQQGLDADFWVVHFCFCFVNIKEKSSPPMQYSLPGENPICFVFLQFFWRINTQYCFF